MPLGLKNDHIIPLFYSLLILKIRSTNKYSIRLLKVVPNKENSQNILWVLSFLFKVHPFPSLFSDPNLIYWPSLSILIPRTLSRSHGLFRFRSQARDPRSRVTLLVPMLFPFCGTKVTSQWAELCARHQAVSLRAPIVRMRTELYGY